jgi:hypothetical protein
MRLRRERASIFSSPLSSEGKMPPTLPSLLEKKLVCTVAIGEAILPLPTAVGVSLEKFFVQHER